MNSTPQNSRPAGSRRRTTIALGGGILACLTAAVLPVGAAAATPTGSLPLPERRQST